MAGLGYVGEDGQWHTIGDDPSMPSSPAAPKTAPTPEVPFSADVPKFGKPIGPDVPEPKWDQPQRQSSHPLSGIIGDAAKKHGLDPRSFGAMMMIESGGNPALVNKYGYSGLFQLQPGDFSRSGGQGSVLDPAANADVAARKFAGMSQRFQSQRGRAPTSAELYLMHQQGEGGAAAHWGAPDKPAWQNMLSTAEGRQKGADWARRAIWDNVPSDVKARFGSVDNITSADFTKIWSDKVGRFEQRFAGGAAPQITAQEALPTSMTSSPGQPRGRGMLDFIKGMFGSPAAASEAQQPVTAESIIANLDRLGVAKDDPMRGTYEYLAQSLAGGRKPQPEMAGWQKGLGVFADTLGAGLGRRGGNSAAQPIFMDMLKQQDADRKALEDRQYQAPLQLIQSTMPYRMKDVERQRRDKMIQSILGGPQAPGGAAPIAPGGAQGVQMAPAPTPGAPVTPVQRGPLPPPGVGLPPEELGDRPGGPPAAGLPAAPAMPQPQAAAPGGLPAPQQQALPPSTPAQGMPQPAAPGAAPSGPAGSGSKFRVTPEEVERRFPLPHDPRRITAMSAYDDKMADNMRQQNELALKQREQFIKMYEVGRATDDPDATEAKETAKLDAKRKGDIKTAQTDAGRAIIGITNSIKALDDLAVSPKFTEKAIGAFDTSDEGILPWGFGPSGKTLARAVTSFNDVGSDEVRTAIEQRARGIAATMKPFVRKPGEGAWSDKDQEALENMVGDLTKARDATDLRRRVRNIHSFIGDTFAKPLGVEVKDHGLPDVGGTASVLAGKDGQQTQPAAKSAASEPVGATRTISGQPYVKTPQGWVPASAGATPQQQPQAPESPAGGMTPQQQAVMDQMKRLGIDPATAMGGR